jgi:hypothetical protein
MVSTSEADHADASFLRKESLLNPTDGACRFAAHRQDIWSSRYRVMRSRQARLARKNRVDDVSGRAFIEVLGLTSATRGPTSLRRQHQETTKPMRGAGRAWRTRGRRSSPVPSSGCFLPLRMGGPRATSRSYATPAKSEARAERTSASRGRGDRMGSRRPSRPDVRISPDASLAIHTRRPFWARFTDSH